MKLKRIYSLLLCLALVAVLIPVPAHAAGGLTIDSVRFDPYEDSYGSRDDTLVMVTVNFSAPETMRQLTVVLASSDIKTVATDNKYQVIYQNQINTPQNGSFSFPVEKARIASATGKEQPDGETLVLRLGGTGTSGVSKSVAYELSRPLDGDLNNDKKVTAADALLVLRYAVGLTSLTTTQLEAADVVRDGTVDIYDAFRILQYEAKLVQALVTDE